MTCRSGRVQAFGDGFGVGRLYKKRGKVGHVLINCGQVQYLRRHAHTNTTHRLYDFIRTESFSISLSQSNSHDSRLSDLTTSSICCQSVCRCSILVSVYCSSIKFVTSPSIEVSPTYHLTTISVDRGPSHLHRLRFLQPSKSCKESEMHE